MKEMKLSKETKEQMLNSIKAYFYEERNEDLGDLAAQLILDFVTKEIGYQFYNQGVRDAHAYLSKKLEDIYEIEKYPK